MPSVLSAERKSNTFKKIVLLLSIITLIPGCGTTDKHSPEKDIQSLCTSPYTAQCTATVKSNKTENLYKYTCCRSNDGEQRINYGDTVFVISHNGAYIERDGSRIETSVNEQVFVMDLNWFFESYSKNGTLSREGDIYVLQCTVPGESDYLSRGVMELDKNCIPKRMIVKNSDGEEAVIVEIEKFTGDIKS